MTCDAFRPLLHPYLDGELEASGLAQAESHLAACASCREQVAEYRRLRGLVREAMPLRAPRSLRDPARWKASRSGPHDETRR